MVYAKTSTYDWTFLNETAWICIVTSGRWRCREADKACGGTGAELIPQCTLRNRRGEGKLRKGPGRAGWPCSRHTLRLSRTGFGTPVTGREAATAAILTGCAPSIQHQSID